MPQSNPFSILKKLEHLKLAAKVFFTTCLFTLCTMAIMIVAHWIDVSAIVFFGCLK